MVQALSTISDVERVRQYQKLIELELLKMDTFVAAEMTPNLCAAGVTMPGLMMRVLKDARTRHPENAQRTIARPHR